MFQRNTLALSPGSRGPRGVAVDSFEVLVTIYKSTQHIIQGLTFQHHCENLKSCILQWYS